MTIFGTTVTPGHILEVMRVAASRTSGRRGEDGPRPGSPNFLTVTCSSATIFFSVDSTYSGESSGRTRQFTVAAASCGSAFKAWPPSSMVATQVVRKVEFHAGEAAATRSIAGCEPEA